MCVCDAAVLNQRNYDRARSYLPTNFANVYRERIREQTNTLLQIGTWRFQKQWKEITPNPNDVYKRTVWVPELRIKSGNTSRKRGAESLNQRNHDRARMINGDLEFRAPSRQRFEDTGGVVSWRMLTGSS